MHDVEALLLDFLREDLGPAVHDDADAVWVALEPNSLKGTFFFGSVLATNVSYGRSIRLIVNEPAGRARF